MGPEINMDSNKQNKRKLTRTGLWRILFGSVLTAFTLYAVLLLKGKTPAKLAAELWDAAVLTLTAGLVFCGVLEIYGTTSRLTAVYFVAAAILALAAVVSGLLFSCARV